MADYTVEIRGLRPDERDPNFIAQSMAGETLHDEVGSGHYGTLKSVEVDGGTARLTMTGALPELARRLDGKVYKGLYG